jgi:hypothetical protein
VLWKVARAAVPECPTATRELGPESWLLPTELLAVTVNVYVPAARLEKVAVVAVGPAVTVVAGEPAWLVALAV